MLDGESDPRWFGYVLMNVGELGNFTSYAFAPASVVAPLGTVSSTFGFVCFYFSSFFSSEHPFSLPSLPIAYLRLYWLESNFER